jgi:hypothetical protein
VIGYYYTADGETHASPGRPTQPLISVDLEDIPQQKPHAALLWSGHIVNLFDFDPLISRPVTDTALSEPAYDSLSWYPSKPFIVNRLANPARLVVVPAQYQGTEQSGTEKLFQKMEFDVYYAHEQEDDFVVPDILKVEALTVQDATSFQVEVEDESGVERVVVTYAEDGEHWQSQDLIYDSLSGTWKGGLIGLSGEVSYFVQAVDGAGNVSMTANKGFFFEPTRLEVYLPLVLRNH